MGVKTGANRCFFIDQVRLYGDSARLVEEQIDIPLRHLVRCVRGRDIRRWKASASTWMLWPPAEGCAGLPWARRFATANGVTAEDLKLAYVRPEHLETKVVWKDVSRGMQAVVLPSICSIEGREIPLVPNQTAYCVDAASMDEAFLLSAVLNSTVAGALLVAVADQAKDRHYRYFANTVGSMPLPDLESNRPASRSLARLARAAHRGGEVQRQLDSAVAEIYGITQRELILLGEFLRERLDGRR